VFIKKVTVIYKLKNMKKLSTSLLLLLAAAACAQQKPAVHSYAQINPSEWVIPRNDAVDYSFGQYQGKTALLMKRKIRDYKAGTPVYPKNLSFTDGTIEADMAWPPDKGGYIGLAFRIKDEHHYDVVYFRPESSGTINAIQYMPALKVDFDWWDYEANKYQAVATLPLHDWFHIKLVVKGSTLTVFVNNQPKPAMVYKALDSSLKSGSVGYWLGNSAVEAFRGLVVKGD
jgi:hypothetical protein